MLAKHLKKVDHNPHPISIHTAKVKLTCNAILVPSELKHHLSHLYTTPSSFSDASAGDFFQNINLPFLPSYFNTMPFSEITSEEIIAAIKSLKSSKCASPDGYTPLFFKKIVTF